AGSDGVSVLLGQGDGSFQPGNDYYTGTAVSGVAVADVNGDGIPDLVVTAGSVHGLLGLGDGSFQTSPISHLAGGTPLFLTAADLNGDGRPDLVTANPLSSDVSVLLNDGVWDGMAPRRSPSHGPHSGGVAAAPLAAELLSLPGDSGAPGQPDKATPVLLP